MAVVRARSSPPYGLFAAVTFAIIATAAAVIFYVMWSKSIDDRDSATTKLAKIANDADQRSLGNLVGSFDEQHTAVGQLSANVSKLNSDLMEARRTIDRLTSDAKSKQDTIDTLTALAKSASDRAAAFEKSMGDQEKTFDAAIASMKDAQVKLERDVASANGLHDESVKKAQSDLNDALQKAEDERRKLVLNLEDANSQIAKLNAEIVDLRLRITNFGTGKTDVSVGEPDGKVIRVNGAAGEVYISLGKKDHIKPGMPFTAYDPRMGVRFGTDEQAQGNGSLEVIEVGDDTSICRITHTVPNRAIQANDLIANLVYHNDRTRKFHFTVFGDFDLDGDGVATAAERDRLISLIQSWGGEVDDDVTSQTDYLVLGEMPKAPLVQDSSDATTAPATEAATTAPSGTAGDVTDARSKDQQRYKDLEIAATRLAIPVLNQNRFLAMVGYYNTTVVRY